MKTMDVALSGHYTLGRIARAAVPCVVMMLVTSVYSIVDGFFISNFVGTQAFASVNLIWPPIMMLGALGLMVGAGGSALVSKTMGEGCAAKANAIFSMLVYFALAVGVVLAVVFALLARPIALMLGAEGGMVEECVLYGRICIVALPFFLISMAFQSFYMTAGKPHLGTLMSVVSGVVNIVLDALFVVVLRWGVAGTAMATATAQIVGGAFPLVYFASSRNGSLLRLLPTAMEWRHVGRSCVNGLSEYVGNVAMNVACICYNLQLMRYLGQEGVAAFGIVMYVGFIFGAVFIGYNIGVAPVIGFNYGAQNRAELRSLLRKSLCILACAGLVLTLVAELLSGALAGMFVAYDPALHRLTAHACRLYMFSFLICGINMFVSALFTALNNGVVSAVAAFARTMIFEIAAIFVLPLLLGVDGIWLAVDVAEVFALVLSVALVVGFRRRYGY